MSPFVPSKQQHHSSKMETLSKTCHELINEAAVIFVFLGLLLRVDPIKWVSDVRLYVRLSVHAQTVSFDFNEIWYVHRGR